MRFFSFQFVIVCKQYFNCYKQHVFTTKSYCHVDKYFVEPEHKHKTEREKLNEGA